MTIWCIDPILGDDDASGVFVHGSADPWGNAMATVEAWLVKRAAGTLTPPWAADDPMLLAVGNHRPWSNFNGRVRYLGCDRGDDPGSTVSDLIANTPSGYARVYAVVSGNGLYYENSGVSRLHWIHLDGQGFTIQRLFHSYEGTNSTAEAFNCRFSNAVQGIWKIGAGTSVIRAHDCQFDGLSGAAVYKPFGRVEIEDCVFQDTSFGVHWLNSSVGQTGSWVKRSTFRQVGWDSSGDCIRVDGKVAGDSMLVEQVTIDDCVNGVNNTSANAATVTTTVDSCIITRTTFPFIQAGGVLNYLYSDLFDNENAAQGTDGGNNISADPLFLARGNGDFRLTLDESPCIGTGNPDIDPGESVNIGAKEAALADEIRDSLKTALEAATWTYVDKIKDFGVSELVEADLEQIVCTDAALVIGSQEVETEQRAYSFNMNVSRFELAIVLKSTAAKIKPDLTSRELRRLLTGNALGRTDIATMRVTDIRPPIVANDTGRTQIVYGIIEVYAFETTVA